MTTAPAAVLSAPEPAGPGPGGTDAITWSEFTQSIRQAQRTGLCERPIRLRGKIVAIDRDTGELRPVYDTATDEAGGVLHVPCGNRRETACAPCSTVYKRDARQLVRAGLLRLGHHQWTQRRLLSDQLTMASADGQDQGNADGDTRCGTEKAGRTRRRPTWPVRRPPSDQGAAPDLDDAPALAKQAGLDN